tara:strand:- start:2212 stop:2526 length:315 start_codon:yes stop_codon:yes gene_type:complete
MAKGEKANILKYCDKGCDYVWETSTNFMYPYKYTKQQMPTYGLTKSLCPPCQFKKHEPEIIAMWKGLMCADIGDVERLKVLKENYNYRTNHFVALLKKKLGYEI